jgi:predicted nucleic acid-binding protein
MKYVDTSALLRVLFCEPGPSVPLTSDERIVTSQLLEVEAFRAVDRARLLGQLDDAQTARKRKELIEMVAMLDVMPIDSGVIDGPRAPSR